MTVSEFVKLDVSGMLFELVDANKTGYLTFPEIIIMPADKNVVKNLYGDLVVVGFEGKTKKTMILYVK